MGLSPLACLSLLGQPGWAEQGSADFQASAGAWEGGTLGEGVLRLDQETAELELGEFEALGVTLRLRPVDAERLELALGTASWVADYGARSGGIVLDGVGEPEAIPFPPEQRTWVPDSQPLIVPDGPGWYGGDALHCEVIVVDGVFYLYWTGALSPGYGYRQIGVATSTDGKNWTPYVDNPVLRIDYDTSTVDGIHVHMPTVVVDPDSGQWSMFYSCYQNGVGNRICRATSGDGLNWAPRGVALDLGAVGEVDSGSLRMPDVLIDEAGTWHMLYNATDPVQHYGPTAYATSKDGVQWTKQGAITADETRLQGGGMLVTAYGVEQWWNCADAFCTSVADLSNWSSWVDSAEPILVKNWAAWNSGYVQAPSPWQIGQQLHMWFNAYDYAVGNEVIAHAQSEPKAGAWMELVLDWDGETLQVQLDEGPVLEVPANGGTLSLRTEGVLELDQADWTWTPVEEPVDTQDSGEPVDSALQDSAPHDTSADPIPRMPSSPELEEPACGCAGGAGAGSSWLVGVVLLGWRRRRLR